MSSWEKMYWYSESGIAAKSTAESIGFVEMDSNPIQGRTLDGQASQLLRCSARKPTTTTTP